MHRQQYPVLGILQFGTNWELFLLNQWLPALEWCSLYRLAILLKTNSGFQLGVLAKTSGKTDTWVTQTVPFWPSATCRQNSASPHSSSSAYSSNGVISTTNSFPVLWHPAKYLLLLHAHTGLKLQTEVTLIYSVCRPLSYITVALDCPKPGATLHFPTCPLLGLASP